MRRVCLTLAVALLAWQRPARGGEVYEKDGTTIIPVKVFDLPDINNPAIDVQADVQVMQAFVKAFPAIFARKYREVYHANPAHYGQHDWDRVAIDLSAFSGIRVEGVESDLLAIAGGMAPDILYLNFRKSDNYVRSNFLYPLDAYFARLRQEEIDFRVHPRIWPVIARKGPGNEKHIWAMPYGGVLGKVLLFRRDLFDAAGMAYPDDSWTWEDLLDACRRITDPARGVYGIRLGAGKHESWHWITFLWSAGGEVMTYDEAGNEWRCTFDSDEAALALDFYTRLGTEKWVDGGGKVRRGYALKSSAEMESKWQRGEIAMMFGYIDEKLFSVIDPDVTGMAPVPLGPSGHRGAELNSRMYGLFAGIKDPVIRDAAWEYMVFSTSKEAVGIRTKAMVEGGLGRFVNPKYLRMFGYGEIERLSPRGWAECFETAIATGKPEPYGRNSNVAYDMMSLPLQQAAALSLKGELPADPQERLKVLKALLVKGCERANTVMIGHLSPAERRLRRIAASVVLVLLGGTFGVVFRRVIKVFTPATASGNRQQGWNVKKFHWAYLLMLPAGLTILVWHYVPLLRGSVMAFYDYQLLGESTFVGIDNFGDLLFDSAWWKSVLNALRYSLLVMTMTFLPPIILAILLQEIPRGKVLFRTIYYLPAVITGLVTALLWKQFYAPSEAGALNAVVMRIPAIGYIAVGLLLLSVCVAFARRLWLHSFHLAAGGFLLAGGSLLFTFSGFAGPILIGPGETLSDIFPHLATRLWEVQHEPYRWLTDPDTAMLACIIPMIWAGMGPGCLIYLAALKGIPDDYYEAADMDGATFVDKILFVIFPMLKSLIIINFVGVFIASWYSATGNILVMTGGGANTETAGLHIWYKAFTFLQFGPATAMAWMLGFLLVGFTVHQLRILSRVEFRTTGSRD